METKDVCIYTDTITLGTCEPEKDRIYTTHKNIGTIEDIYLFYSLG
jgi:hypothetical protein